MTSSGSPDVITFSLKCRFRISSVASAKRDAYRRVLPSTFLTKLSSPSKSNMSSSDMRSCVRFRLEISSICFIYVLTVDTDFFAFVDDADSYSLKNREHLTARTEGEEAVRRSVVVVSSKERV